jgi:hypothetical protein
MMNAARQQVRRIESALVLTLVGALLLLSVVTGEARAATLTPLPSGDDDAEGTEGLTFVGAEECSGFFGLGKFVVDLGVGADHPDFAARRDAVSLTLGGSDVTLVDDLSGFPLALVLEGVLEGALGDHERLSEFGAEASPTEFLYAVWVRDLRPCALDLDLEDYEDYAFLDSVPVIIEGEAGAWTLELEGAITFVVWGVGFNGAAVRAWPEGEEYDPNSCHAWTVGVIGDDGPGEAFEALGNFGIARTMVELAAPLIDCTGETRTVAPQPVSTLALSCEPTVVTVGQQVTCEVTGGDPNVTILWSASASPAFAGQGVTLGADGRGSFTFMVPASAQGRAITVELVDWVRTAVVQVAGSQLVPTGVPAGQGSGPLGALLLAGAALLATVTVRSRVARAAVDHEG